MKKIATITAVAVFAGTLASHAQTTDTWTGLGPDANWSDAGNWTPGAPNPGDSLVFSGSTQITPNNDTAADTLFGGILFAPTASTFTLTGNEITLSGLVENDATNQAQNISLPLVLSGAVTFNTSSNDVNGGASDDIYVNANISGTGSLIKTGVGSLFLTNGVNSFSGGATINNGLLDINTGGTFTMAGGALLLDYRSYYTAPTINFTADSAVGISLLDNAEPRGVDVYSTIGTAGFKFTKIGVGILRMVGSINASSIDVAEGTLGSLGGAAQPQTRWGTSPITVEVGAMLRADDGGVCPNAITLMGGDGTTDGSYTHLGVLISSSRNNGASTTNYNIFTNTITLANDSTIGSYFNTMIISGNITGPGALTTLGTDTSPLLLSGSNSFTGGLTLNTGILQIGSSNALPLGVSVTVVASSILDLNGNNAAIGGSFYDDSTALGKVDNSSATAAVLTLNGGSLTDPVMNSGGGPLTIVNASGSTSLLGVNKYSGGNLVQAGTLEINIPTGTTNGGPLLIADNATLTLHKTTPGSSLKAAGATIGTSGATTLNIDLNNYGNPSAPIINATNGTGVLAANGTLTINFLNTANLSLGEFAIIKYTSRTGLGNFVFMPISGITANVVTNTANKSIDLKITSAPIVTWKGNHNNLWDYTTANWTLSGSPLDYSDGISIFFDDTALTTNVDLTTTLSPGSVLLNTTNTYTFGGLGSLGGGALTKNGSGTLILDVVGNSYASTTVGGGTLQVGNHDNNGDLASGNVDDEGTLVFSLTNNYALPGAISGAGMVVQNDTNTVTLSQADTYSGGTLINQGILKQGNIASLGVPAGPVLVTVASGASLDLGGKNAGTVGLVSIAGNGESGTTGGALQTTAGMGCDIGCTAVGVKYLQLAANASIGDNTGDFQLGTNGNANANAAGVGMIDGQGFALTKIGNNNLIVEATNRTALSQFTLAGGGMIFANSAKTPFGTTCLIVLSNNTFMDSWDNYANSGITIPNNVVIGPGGSQLRNTHGMYYGHACYNTYSGAFTLNDQLTVLNTATFNGGPGNVATSGTMTFSGPISGAGGINCTNGNPDTYGGVTSVNTETLTGANTYTGPTVVYQGLLKLSPMQQGGGAYFIYDNSTLDVPSQTGYSTVPMSTLMVGSATGGTLSLGRVTALSSVNAPITATNLSVIGNNTVLLPPSAYGAAPGEYPLIKYTTGPSGYGTVGTISVGGGVRGVPGYVTNDTANSEIAFVVSGGTPVLWTGNANNSWDINASLDWTTNSVATTYQQTGSLGDAVTFDDTSSVTNVNIPAPVAPTVAIFNLTNRNYTLSGTNITGAASLVKNGAGTLVLSNFNNNFTAGTIVNAGTLKMATALSPLVALNNLTGTVTVNSGGTLDMGSNNLTSLIINASGAGVGGNGAIQANYSGNQQGWGITAVNQTGNLTIGGTGRWDVRNGTEQWNVSTNGLTLTKVGAGYIGLVATAVSTNLGDITILGGTLDFQTSTTGEGNTNNTIYVGNGGNLGFYQLATRVAKAIVCSNGASLLVDGGNTLGQNVIVGPVTLLSGTTTVKGNYFNGLYVSNTISGAGGLTLQYQTYLYLAASNTFTGQVTIPYCNATTQTRLSLIGNGSITHASLIYLNGIQPGQQSPGIIDASGRVDGTMTLAVNQVLRGDNGAYIKGNVVAAAGSAIAPGGINNSNYQYMCFSNNLTLQAGSTNYMDIYKTGTLLTNDLMVVSNLVTYGGTLQIQTNGPTALAVGDSFKLFSAGSATGNFATIADNSGTSWSFNPATGVAMVTALPPTVNMNPATANFQAAITGGALHFTWAPDHLGWQLYTNAVGLTDPNSWFPVSGSATVTNAIINVNPANPNVFFQLRYP